MALPDFTDNPVTRWKWRFSWVKNNRSFNIVGQVVTYNFPPSLVFSRLLPFHRPPLFHYVAANRDRSLVSHPSEHNPVGYIDANANTDCVNKTDTNVANDANRANTDGIRNTNGRPDRWRRVAESPGVVPARVLLLYVAPRLSSPSSRDYPHIATYLTHCPISLFRLSRSSVVYAFLERTNDTFAWFRRCKNRHCLRDFFFFSHIFEGRVLQFSSCCLWSKFFDCLGDFLWRFESSEDLSSRKFACR